MVVENVHENKVSCKKNKVSYHVFMLLLLAHEVHMRNQEPRTNKSDWSIRISYALNIQNALSPNFTFTDSSHTTNLRKFLAPQHFHIIFTEWVVWHFTCWLRYVLLCVSDNEQQSETICWQPDVHGPLLLVQQWSHTAPRFRGRSPF